MNVHIYCDFNKARLIYTREKKCTPAEGPGVEHRWKRHPLLPSLSFLLNYAGDEIVQTPNSLSATCPNTFIRRNVTLNLDRRFEGIAKSFISSLEGKSLGRGRPCSD